MKKPTTKKTTKRNLNTTELVKVQGGWTIIPLYSFDIRGNDGDRVK